MTTETIATVKASLSGTFASLDDLFELPSDQLHYRPPREDAWTMAEHLEHVALVNRYLLIIIRKGVAKALKRGAALNPTPMNSNLDLLSAIAEPGAFTWPAPQHMLPTGRANLTEVRETLRQQRNETLALLYSMAGGEGTLHTIRMSVNNLGKIDMYQWLYFLAQHARHHLSYIDLLRTKSRPSY